MSKLTEIHWKKFEKFLLKWGCKFSRQKGSHRSYWKDGICRPLIIQAKGKVPIFIIKSNLKTLGMTTEEYIKIIEKL